MTLHARHGSHGPSELVRLERENAALRAEVARLQAIILNIQALAERGFPIDTAKLAKRCQAALEPKP